MHLGRSPCLKVLKAYSLQLYQSSAPFIYFFVSFASYFCGTFIRKGFSDSDEAAGQLKERIWTLQEFERNTALTICLNHYANFFVLKYNHTGVIWLPITVCNHNSVLDCSLICKALNRFSVRACIGNGRNCRKFYLA